MYTTFSQILEKAGSKISPVICIITWILLFKVGTLAILSFSGKLLEIKDEFTKCVNDLRQSLYRIL